MNDNEITEELITAANRAREAGSKWLLRADARDHIPLLFGQTGVFFEHSDTIHDIRRLMAQVYRVENGYRTELFDIQKNEVVKLTNTSILVLKAAEVFKDTDMNRTPERIQVLPFNRMSNIVPHLEPLINKELKFGLAYEYHRRIKQGQSVSVEGLVQELIDRDGPVAPHELVDARAADKSIAKHAPENQTWTSVDLDNKTRRHMLALDDPKMPYYESWSSLDGEIYRLHFVVPARLAGREYRELVDQWSIHGIGPYKGEERTGISADATKRGLPPLDGSV